SSILNLNRSLSSRIRSSPPSLARPSSTKKPACVLWPLNKLRPPKRCTRPLQIQNALRSPCARRQALLHRLWHSQERDVSFAYKSCAIFLPMPTTYDDRPGLPPYPRDNPLFLIAGPCVIESETHARMMAQKVARIAEDAGIPYFFKASYDKA